MFAPCRSSVLESPFRRSAGSPLGRRGVANAPGCLCFDAPALSRLRPARGPKNPTSKTPERPLGEIARDRPLFSWLRARAGPARSSLELNLRADLLQGGLDLLGLFLGDAFLDGLRRAFDEILGLLQAERGDRADFLDDLDLLFADGGEDDRELGLLLGRGSGGRAGGGSGGDRNRSGGRDAPLGFEEFGELRGFENRQGGEFVDDLFQIGHF